MPKWRYNGILWSETLLTHQNHDTDSFWVHFWKNKKFKKYHFLMLRNSFYDNYDTPSQKKVIKNVGMFFNHWKGSWYWGIGSVQLPLTFWVFSKVLWCSGEVRKEVKILKNFFSKSLFTWSIINENTLHLVPEQRRTTRQQKLKIFQVLSCLSVLCSCQSK